MRIRYRVILPVFLYEDDYFRVYARELGLRWNVRAHSKRDAHDLAERLSKVMGQCGYLNSAIALSLAHWGEHIEGSDMADDVWGAEKWTVRQAFHDRALHRLVTQLRSGQRMPFFGDGTRP